MFCLAGVAQKWEVPAKETKKNASFKFDNAATLKGKEIYNKNCMSCHGTPTKKDYAQLPPNMPGDVSEDRFKNQTDGALFYKLQQGRGLMPSFKTTLSTREKWEVIAYIRTFHEGYTQIIQAVDPNSLAEIIMTLTKKEGDKFSVQAMKILNGKESIGKNLEIAIYLKRYFNDMKLGGTLVTDANGYAEFTVSPKVVKDREGKIELIAKAPEYEGSQGTASFDYGMINDKPSLIEERAFWNRPDKAPIALQALYFAGLFFFLSIAGYVVMRLMKLKNEK